MKKKTICVIGLGYIGLPTAALIANKGYSVSGIDVNQDVISTVNNGETAVVHGEIIYDPTP